MHDPGVPRRAKAKRSSLGVYWRNGVAWMQLGGERFSLRTRDPQAAQLRAQHEHRKRADPAYAAAHEATLGDACSAWLAAAPTEGNRSKPPAAGTLSMYGYHIGHFGRLLGANTPLGAVEATALDAYVRARREETIGRGDRQVSARTVDKELGTLRRILRFAKRNGCYHHDLDAVFPPRSTGEYRPLNRHLTLEQFPLLLAQLPEARAATCCFLFGLAADWSAVGRAQLADLGSHSHCNLAVLVRGSKNARRFAEVPVVGIFGPYVERARAFLAAHQHFPAWGNSTRDLAAACARAGLPRVTVRDLRRSHGKALRRLGAPPHLIGAMLRHSDSRMAELVYAQLETVDLGRLVVESTLKVR